MYNCYDKRWKIKWLYDISKNYAENSCRFPVKVLMLNVDEKEFKRDSKKFIDISILRQCSNPLHRILKMRQKKCLIQKAAEARCFPSPPGITLLPKYRIVWGASLLCMSNFESDDMASLDRVPQSLDYEVLWFGAEG